ncbi:Protein CBG23479 [Caenorhabditis briggsae]|uniref:Protein CBG23479 n=1 Tax=Caenorhabditis briggsae TaxID=6238 RepID=A8Y3T8_CAEBR|nr:Protein CBG23479 [Caenorhabditis briggsae]CAP39557.2 Protein CBG23479 [Caenorhabditis briggsae]
MTSIRIFILLFAVCFISLNACGAGPEKPKRGYCKFYVDGSSDTKASGRKKRQSGTATGSVDPATGTASGSVSTMSTMSTMTTTTSPMGDGSASGSGGSGGHQNPVNQVNHVVDPVDQADPEAVEEVEAQENSVLKDPMKRPLLPLDHRTLVCNGSAFSNISSAIFALID